MSYVHIRSPRVATRSRLVTLLLVIVLAPSPALAGVVDLAALFANSGFEDDLYHAHWVSTYKSTNYVVTAPVVNPVIVPKGEAEPLEAPAGHNFVGVLNPDDADINGRLVHDATAGVFPAGTVFTLTAFANRGRLAGAPTALFESTPSTVTFQLFGWRAGAQPVVNPYNDNWSRTPAVTVNRSFTNWGPNGEWASQTFQFVTSAELRYVALSITVKNHKRASYAAFDVLQTLVSDRYPRLASSGSATQPSGTTVSVTASPTASRRDAGVATRSATSLSTTWTW